MWALVGADVENTGVQSPAVILSSDRSNEAGIRNLLNTGRYPPEWIKIWGRDSSTPTKVRFDIGQQIDKYFELWKLIFPRPGEILFLTRKAAEFMEVNNLASFVMQAGGMVTSSLNVEKFMYWAPVVELARDIEAPEWSALKIIIEIENRSYSEILDMWERVCKRFYEGLDKEIAKKIYIIMKRKKSN